MAPPPTRSERPGEAVALLYRPANAVAPLLYPKRATQLRLYLLRNALGCRHVERQVALAAADGELERMLGGEVRQRLAGRVAADHGRVVDLQDHVARLQAGALGGAAADHQRHRRRAGAGAPRTNLG